MEYTPQAFQAFHQRTFHYEPGNRLASIDEAVSYINERGFIFFWPHKGVRFPSLWTATAGDRPVPDEHDDPGHITWDWKDKLLGKRRVYYARLVKKRNTFVNLQLAPYFYALSPNYGDFENDYHEQYRLGNLPMEAKSVYEALLKEGPLDSLALRKTSRLSSTESDGRFNKALETLQVEMKVLPVGIAEVGAWRYAFIYDIVARYYPEIETQAGQIDEYEARRHLIMTAMRSLGYATEAEIRSLFSWRLDDVRRALTKLVEVGSLIPGITITDKKGEHYCLPDLIN